MAPSIFRAICISLLLKGENMVKRSSSEFGWLVLAVIGCFSCGFQSEQVANQTNNNGRGSDERSFSDYPATVTHMAIIDREHWLYRTNVVFGEQRIAGALGFEVTTLKSNTANVST